MLISSSELMNEMKASQTSCSCPDSMQKLNPGVSFSQNNSVCSQNAAGRIIGVCIDFLSRVLETLVVMVFVRVAFERRASDLLPFDASSLYF